MDETERLSLQRFLQSNHLSIMSLRESMFFYSSRVQQLSCSTPLFVSQ